jgi:hypothetical protein
MQDAMFRLEGTYYESHKDSVLDCDSVCLIAVLLGGFSLKVKYKLVSKGDALSATFIELTKGLQ